MVELIDKIWHWLIVNAPSWKWTARLMHYRHKWYTKWRKWDEDKQEWVKI